MTSTSSKPSRLKYLLTVSLPPVLTLVVGLALWEAAVRGFGIPVYLLPAPGAILSTFFEQPVYLLRIGLYSFSQALAGFVIGCLLGTLVAAVCVPWRSLARGLVPFSVASNAIPIIALSPLLGVWLGSTSPASKIAVVAIMTFFPTLVNVYQGLTSPGDDAVQLLRSYAASQREIFLKLRLPAALPALFTALKLCAPLSMIGVVVAEFFGGLRDSLGVFIKANAGLLHMKEAWAAILVAGLIGITFYLVIVTAERLCIPWHVSLRSEEG